MQKTISNTIVPDAIFPLFNPHANLAHNFHSLRSNLTYFLPETTLPRSSHPCTVHQSRTIPPAGSPIKLQFHISIVGDSR